MNRAVPDPAAEPVVSVERVAAILGICRSSAYNAVAAGQIPAFRVGRRLKVPTAWLVRTLSADSAA